MFESIRLSLLDVALGEASFDTERDRSRDLGLEGIHLSTINSVAEGSRYDIAGESEQLIGNLSSPEVL